MNVSRLLIIDFLLFFTVLFCAWFFQWKANDLVWSLWVTSLTIGYTTLIFGPLFHKIPWKIFLKNNPFAPEFWNQLKENLSFPTSIKDVVVIVVIFFLGAIFFIGFFTVHFGMFHFIHGIFLNDFFPLEGLTYPENPLKLPYFAIELASKHWQFVLASAISQLLRIDVKSDQSFKRIDLTRGPYKAVIRMHLMIFLFAYLDTIEVDHFIFYAVILLVYFLPWKFRHKSI